MAALLIRGGYLYPADPEHRVIPDGAVLVESGTITAVGPTPEVEAAVSPDLRVGLEVIEARGSMILPGFVNPHWHEMFAMRFPFKGALRPPSDREDQPAFMALGGDIQGISTAFDRFADLIGQLTPDEAEAIARYSMWTQLRSGVTTLGDVGSFNHPRAMAAAARHLGLRCSLSTWAGDARCEPGQTRFRRTRDADQVLAGVEELVALAAADPTGLIRARPSAVYSVNMSDELGTGLADLVRRHDLPFATHVGALRHEVEVSRTYFGATPVRRMAELGLLSDRFTAVHCAFADDDERKLLAEARAHISLSPAKYGPAGESTVTETRAMPEYRRMGLSVSVSTDGAPLPVPGMAENMRAVWQQFNELAADPTEVRPTDALAMATRIAAEGLDWPGIGSLEPGHRADLQLVRADDWRYLLNPRPLEGFLALGGSTDVHTVIVDGRVRVADGRPVGLDETDLSRDYLDALGSFSVRCLGVDPEVVAERRRALTPTGGL
uniref:MichA n=1 Tax=Micromonospora sp. SCSIO 07395 TaxID=2998119 RepID=A0A9E9F235_9ACTN|nr:MichA [Micromonospora sp. SCSIO 07395]